MKKKNTGMLLLIFGLVFLLNPGRILAGDYQAIGTPENLSIAPTTRGFLVSWDPGPGDPSVYKIYWGNDDPVNEVDYAGILTTSQTSYEHSGLVPGHTYYYRVMACGCDCSPLSNPVSGEYRPASGDVYVLSGTVTVNNLIDPRVMATIKATEVSGANQGNSVSINPDGTFRMALFPGTYNISVDCLFGESWEGTWINFGAWGYPGPQNLSIGADTARHIDIPVHALTGTIKDTSGNPIPDVELSCSQGSTKTSAEAGFEGTYKLYFLPGTYSLEVKPPAGTRFCPVTVDVDVPGTAPPIVLQEQFLLSGRVTVNGSVNPMMTATVRAAEVSGANQGNSVSTEPDGTFRMALASGSYNISVDYGLNEFWNGTWISVGSWGYPGPQNLSIGADTVREIDIPVHALTGTVKDTNGNPIPDVELSYSHGSATTSAEAGFEGNYKLYFLPGTYSLEVKPPAGTRFCPVTVDVDVPGTAPPIVLQEQFLLSGRVTVNGSVNPMITAKVRATEVSGANQGNSAGVDADGTFRMALAPGTYNISVDCSFGESWNGTLVNVGFWDYPGPQGLSVGADTVQDLDIPVHALTGTIKDTSGNPIPGVELNYWGPYSQGSTATSADAGLEGTYKLYFLPGTYGLQVVPPPALFPPFQLKKVQIMGDSTRDIGLGSDSAVLDQAIAMMSPNLELHLDVLDVITGGASGVYHPAVSSPRDLAQIIVNWAGTGMQVNLYRPDDTLYDQYQSDSPPVIIDIQDPEVGTWTCEVIADDTSYDSYPVAVVAGLTPNQPPVADAGGPYSGTTGTAVVFDAGNSQDPDGMIVLYEWDWENDGVFDQNTTHPNVTHAWEEPYDGFVRLRVTDNEGLIEVVCASLQVSDTLTPPEIILSVCPDTLWPPNHKMVPVVVDTSASHFNHPEAFCRIISVSSNEPEDGQGDGHTYPDWEITGDLTVDLRAERSGTGDGRIYTITVECADGPGNTATATAEVTVPHDMGKKKCHIKRETTIPPKIFKKADCPAHDCSKFKKDGCLDKLRRNVQSFVHRIFSSVSRCFFKR